MGANAEATPLAQVVHFHLQDASGRIFAVRGYHFSTTAGHLLALCDGREEESYSFACPEPRPMLDKLQRRASLADVVWAQQDRESLFKWISSHTEGILKGTRKPGV